MSEVEKNLESMGVTLPDVPAPVAAYSPYVIAGNLVFISGNLPMVDGELKHKGRLGDEISPDDGKEAARLAVINAIASLKAAAGDLDRVERIIRIEGFVASTPDFTGHARVVNGASEFILEVFGDRGRHSRFAVGCASLPLGTPVEIGMTAALK